MARKIAGEFIHDDLVLSAALCAVLDGQEWVISGPSLIVCSQTRPVSRVGPGVLSPWLSVCHGCQIRRRDLRIPGGKPGCTIGGLSGAGPRTKTGGHMAARKLNVFY